MVRVKLLKIILIVITFYFIVGSWAIVKATPISYTISQDDWILYYVDSEEIYHEDGSAENAFDGDSVSIWHTRYQLYSPSHPHEIQIDLINIYSISGFRYLPDGENGRVAQYEFYVSSDGVNWGDPVASGVFANDPSEKEVIFPNAVSGRYISFKALSEVNGNPWTSVAEINVLALSETTITPDWRGVIVSPFNLSPPVEVDNPVLTAGDVLDVPADFVADPFLFYENSEWKMFLEVMRTDTKKGNIGLARSVDGIHWLYDKIVLNDGLDLSYPYVFKYNDRYYMIPDTYSENEVRLYETNNFPYDWYYSVTIVDGRSLVDPSIFYYNGLWWLFVSNISNDSCYLYFSPNLKNGWTEHPMSPIIQNDASKARPGGRSFVFDGNRIIRIAQKDDINYGEAVRAFQVDNLTQTEYLEHEITDSPVLQSSGDGWNAYGMHHFDPWWTGNYWLCAVDGNSMEPNPDKIDLWSIGIYVSPETSVIPQQCECDFEPQDKDVDGIDLYVFLMDSAGISLEDLASDFGRIDCP